MIHARIEDLRKRQQPTLFLPYAPTRVLFADGETGERRVSFEWFAEVPSLVSLVVIEGRSGEEVVWSMSRDLFQLAEAEPGYTFRLADVSARMERPKWLHICLHATTEEFLWVRPDLVRTAAWLAKLRLWSPRPEINPAIRRGSRVS